jgi:hypothetical protein
MAVHHVVPPRANAVLPARAELRSATTRLAIGIAANGTTHSSPARAVRVRHRDDRARDLYRLTVAITAIAIVGDAVTSWGMQHAGGVEANPFLIAVKAEVGLAGMIFVLVAAKTSVLAMIDRLWKAAVSFGSPAAKWATVAISMLVCVVAQLPVLHNLTVAR